MNKELIQEAYKVAELWRRSGFEHGVENLLDRLADALYAAVRTGVCHCGEDIENHAAENHSPVEMIYERSTE